MKQPPLTIPATIEVPEAAKHTALNGTPIYAINCPEYEVVRVSFVFHAGSTIHSIGYGQYAGRG